MWKVSNYGVFSGPYFSAFGLNTEIYGVFEKTSYLDTFHAVYRIARISHDIKEWSGREVWHSPNGNSKKLRCFCIAKVRLGKQNNSFNTDDSTIINSI